MEREMEAGTLESHMVGFEKLWFLFSVSLHGGHIILGAQRGTTILTTHHIVPGLFWLLASVDYS